MLKINQKHYLDLHIVGWGKFKLLGRFTLSLDFQQLSCAQDCSIISEV